MLKAHKDVSFSFESHLLFLFLVLFIRHMVVVAFETITFDLAD